MPLWLLCPVMLFSLWGAKEKFIFFWHGTVCTVEHNQPLASKATMPIKLLHTFDANNHFISGDPIHD